MSSGSSWERRLRSALQKGGLDKRRDIFHTKAIKNLASGNEETLESSVDAYSMKVEDYVQKCRTLGDPEFSDLSESMPINHSSSNTITVIRGTPKASLLRYLGSHLGLAAEPLLEHYGFPDTFRIRSLPSRPSSVVVIQFVSLGILNSSVEDTKALREELERQVSEQGQERLKEERIGYDRCRRLNVHDNNIFTVEQQATFLTYNDSWSGILLTDCGLSSATRPWIPRSRTGCRAQFYPATLSGICDMSSLRCHSPFETTEDKRDLKRPNPFLRDSSDKLIMPVSDRTLCLTDPFMFLSDILNTSALSWMLVLSYLRASHEALSIPPSDRAARLRADKVMLDRGASYFANNISLLEYPPITWQRSERSKDVALLLKRDFETLRSEAESLSTWCSDSISIAMSTISISDSQQSLAEARRVQLITFLAFIFIPMTFIASCFGMNVQELGQSGPNLSIYFVVALPFTITILLVPLWRERVWIRKNLEPLKTRIRNLLTERKSRIKKTINA